MFGLSVSSFFYRRHEKGPAQAALFSFMTIWAIIAGWIIGASSNTVLLGWFPWAIDVAMLVGVIRLGDPASVALEGSADEKAVLAGLTPKGVSCTAADGNGKPAFISC